MQNFTPAQISKLQALFLEAGADAISGAWIRAGTIPYSAGEIGAFATGAQGLLADTALQPGDNVSQLVNDANYLSSGDNVSELVNDANYVSTDDPTYRILVAAEWEEVTVNLDIDGVVTPRTVLLKVVP